MVRQCKVIKKFFTPCKPGTILDKNIGSIVAACGGGTAVQLVNPKLFSSTLRPLSGLYLQFMLKTGDKLL